MLKKYGYILSGLFFLFLFVLFSLVVKKYNLHQFDFNITVKIQDHLPRRFDMLFSYLSLGGSFEVLTIVLVAIILATRKIKSLILLGIFGVAHLIEIGGKVLLTHPGPPFMFFRYDLGFYLPSAYVQTGSSYPSGHSFRTVYLSILIAHFLFTSQKVTMTKKIILASCLIAFNFLMLFSRVSLGEHWTSDVIGGTLMGLGLGLVSIPIVSAQFYRSSK